MALNRVYREYDRGDQPHENRVYREDRDTRLRGYYHAYYRNPLSRLLYFLLDILEILLAIRFLFRLFAANPGSPFVSFIYNISAPFVAPFRGIFPPIVSTGRVVEWSTLIAMVVYALLVYLVVRLVDTAVHPV